MYRFRRLLLQVTTRSRIRNCLAVCLVLYLFIAVCVRLTAPSANDLRPTRIRTQSEFDRAIPRIIHQSYKDEQIPKQYWDSVRSWRRKHPDYVYVLWTDADIKRFIEKEYPDFVPLFESYSHNLQRVDAVRYFILYHYGGVYADMDVDALRPLDPLLSRHSCILSRERYEQTMYLWSRKESIMNCVMASAPRHPFMIYVIVKLADFLPSSLAASIYNLFGSTNYILYSTGPQALTDIFYQYKVCMREKSPCDVYLAEPEELLPIIDVKVFNLLRHYCQSWLMAPLRLLSTVKRQACVQLEALGYRNVVLNTSYTNHDFSNLGYESPKTRKAKNRPSKHFRELVGNYKRYGDKI